MNLDTARQLISGMDVTRYELRDHAFGDAEVHWERNGKVIAQGYFGHEASVNVGDSDFSSKDADFLRLFGTPKFERNDETGPDEYEDGKTMPGLTLEGVRRELEEGYSCYSLEDGIRDLDQ